MGKPVTIQIELDIWHRNHQALIDARENVTELMNEHVAARGIDTKKNAYIADMYEKELREINSLLEYSASNNGVPF